MKFFQKIDQFQWLLLLLIAPLFLFIRQETSWVLLIIPLLWGISYLAGEKTIKITSVNLLILVLAVQNLVSLYATYDIAISLTKIGGIVYSLVQFFF